MHRKIKGKIGKITVSKTPSGKYFVSVFTEEDYITPFKITNESVGLDMGLKDLVVTSDGETFNNNRYTRKYEHKLAIAQRHLSRKKKGSIGFEKPKTQSCQTLRKDFQ